MEIATKRWIQLTHDIGRCDFPSWSPDGRHIVFANSSSGKATDYLTSYQQASQTLAEAKTELAPAQAA